MDPFTLALATFGVQKLRGKSTKKALQSAAIVGGGSQLLGMTGMGQNMGLKSFGGPSGISSLRDTTAAQLAGFKGTPKVSADATPFGSLSESQFAAPAEGITSYADDEVRSTFKEIPYKEAKKMARRGELDMDFVKRYKEKGFVPMLQDSFVADDRTYANQRAEAIKKLSEGVTENLDDETLFEKFKNLDAGTKIALATTAMAALPQDDGNDDGQLEGYRKEDYDDAYAEQSANLKGSFVPTQNARPSMSDTINDNMFYANEGGLATALPKFNQGGVNYLPSKTDHNENDYNNYVRAEGYVEDGAGNGNKDEDTMLAQLADGEFVSRADAVLGAGILSGGDPKSYKSMRKAGASFFYDQQKKLKRIYDLVDASKKEN